MKARIGRQAIEMEQGYITRLDANLMIIRAINEHLFLEKFSRLAPLVAAELMKAGVKFPQG